MSTALRKKLEEKARKLKVPNIDKLNNGELMSAIKDRSGEVVSGDDAKDVTPVKSDTGTKLIEGKATELRNVPVPAGSNTTVNAAAPSIVMNVPAPIVNVGTREAPQWFEIVAMVKDAVLWMTLGAAGWALIGARLAAKMGGV